MLGWWQGRGGQENLIPSLREDQCTMASCLGGQSHGVPQDAVSPLPSHVKPHHLPLYPMHPHLHSCFDFQPKQTANLLAAAVPVPMATTHKGTALALMIWICRDRQRGQFRASREIWMQAKLSAGHWAWIHKKKKIGSVQDLSHPINQVILTHPVTWRRLAEQRRRLSGLDGTSNRGVMGKDTTSASVINSVYCWESCCVWSKNTVALS